MQKLPIALGVSVIIALAGCSSSSSGSGGTAPPATTPATTAATTPGPVATGAAGIAAAKTQIKAHWATFFNSNTPHAKAAALLEDGTTLRAAIKLAAKVAKAEKTKESAVVLKIAFAAGGTSATVTYNLLGKKGAPPLISKGTGFAVLQDGTWKVAKTTFCTLVGLGASAIGVEKVPGCQS
jgi:hypothetical protein